MESRRQFRKLLASPGIIQAAGVADAGSAMLVEEAGFPAVYMSGSYVSFTHGWPDLGMVTMTEMAERAACIVKRVKIPVIADADEGYGDAMQVSRTIAEYERAGVAALHIEDMSKTRGAPLPIADMVKRIKGALQARTDPDLTIIMRTDAMASWRTDLESPAARKEDCLKRAVSYAEAGADLVMVMHPDSTETLERFCREVSKPIAVEMGQVTALKGVATSNDCPRDLEKLGIKVGIFATFLMMKMVPVMRRLLSEMRRTGQAPLNDEDRQHRNTLNTLLGQKALRNIQEQYGA